MTVEALKKLVRNRLIELSKPNFYDGMEGDLELVSQRIIGQDPTQNIETVSSDGISAGTPERALEKLLNYWSEKEIAEAIYKRYGQGEIKDKEFDIGTLRDRITDLQNSKNVK